MTVLLRSIRRLAPHAVLLPAAFVMVYPFFWMVRASLRSSAEVFGAVPDAPPIWQSATANYGRALIESPVLQFIANGLFVTTVILGLQIVTSVTAAYALAKLRFRGSGLMTALVVLAMAIPPQVPAFPLFLTLARAHLLDGYFALILPYMTSAFAILMFRQFIAGIPDDIILAARQDGMNEADIVMRIIVPALMPAIAAFAIFSVTFHWNDLYWPMIVIKSTHYAPPTLGILYFRSQDGGNDFGPLMASATLVTLPLIALFLALQRQFVRGMTMSGVK